MRIQQGIVVTAAVAVLAFAFGNLAQRAEGADTAETRARKLEDVYQLM